MKSIKKVNADILKISGEIRSDYPELYENLLEMPVTLPDVASPKINTGVLTEYYQSLKVIVKQYSLNRNLPVENEPV